jgi:hypothetical protein
MAAITGCRLPRGTLQALALALSAASPVHAQVVFDVIGPHEYDLPVAFAPYDVFVQYAYLQNDSKRWDIDGNRVDGSGAQRVVGLSKYVYLWTPRFDRNIGLLWEVIQPETSIRDRAAKDPRDRNRTGLGDPITGFAGWFKPTVKSTFGVQSFMQIPWGESEVSDGNWKNLTSLFWYTPLVGTLDWTGDAGFVWQSANADGISPGTTAHTNNRFGWRANTWLEPFLAVDYEYIADYGSVPQSWALDGGLGVMVFIDKFQSLTARYSTSLMGENHAYNDSWNLKYVYSW